MLRVDRPPRRLLRSRWTIVALGAIVVLATLCIFPATRPSHIDQMRDLPELHLAHPRAVVLRDSLVVDSAGMNPMVLRLLGADASIEAVQDWCRHEATTRGWLPGADASVGASQDELATWGWHTDRYRFRLGFWRPEAMGSAGAGGPDYASSRHRNRLAQTAE